MNAKAWPGEGRTAASNTLFIMKYGRITSVYCLTLLCYVCAPSIVSELSGSTEINR